MQVLVVDGEGPVDLLVPRGAEEVAGVVIQGVGALEPFFVQAQAVGIPRFDNIPCIAKLVAQGFVFSQIFALMLIFVWAPALLSAAKKQL